MLKPCILFLLLWLSQFILFFTFYIMAILQHPFGTRCLGAGCITCILCFPSAAYKWCLRMTYLNINIGSHRQIKTKWQEEIVILNARSKFFSDLINHLPHLGSRLESLRFRPGGHIAHLKKGVVTKLQVYVGRFVGSEWKDAKSLLCYNDQKAVYFSIKFPAEILSFHH